MHIPQSPLPTPPPSLRARQLTFHILTQTLVRPSTTITTTITLGTIDPSSTETTTAAAVPLPVSPHHHSGLSGGQVGAILGSVVGIVVLLLIIGFCYVGRRRMPITYDDEKEYRYKYKRQTHNNNSNSNDSNNNGQRKKAKGKGSRKTRSAYEYEYAEEEAIYYTDAPTKGKRRPSSSSTKNKGATVQEPAPAVVAERIPGGPKYPTYRAIPISNPRNPQIWRTG
ncbi:hypothetical protein CCMA1212_010221 [Trichoderma ghanense]|uniref:Uncharacterized protein n=1 Tax=Trichoderma ghanense TaxID=65468 RepID=A0ABY2GQ70_9HYPO